MITASVVLYRNDLEEVSRVVRDLLRGDALSALLVADNSPDESLRGALPADRRVEYVSLPENVGFGKAHNLALQKYRRSKYHAVVNPDIYFDQPVLQPLRDYMDAQPDVGLVMPKVLNPDGTMQHLCKRIPTPMDLALRRFAPRFMRAYVERRARRMECRTMDYDREMRVPYLSGCFMFLRMSVIRELGGFDERYFMYLEDLDLSRRIAARYRTMYFPEVAVYHRFSKGSYRTSTLRNIHIRSAISYFQKWGWVLDRDRARLNVIEQPASPASSPAPTSLQTSR